MIKKYGLDFFSDVIEAGSGLPFPAFFRINRDGEPKGILVGILAGCPRIATVARANLIELDFSII